MTNAMHASGDATAIQIAATVATQAATYRATRASFAATPPTPTAPMKPYPKRRVYDAQGSEQLPGQLVLNENKPNFTQDTDAQNVFKTAAHIWNFYYDLFGRNSIDGLGMVIRQTIHYSRKYGNAFWDGAQMVYGDGDGDIFGSFSEDIDVIGHELTHGVMQYEANLSYHGESGALNESFADVFGILIKQRALGLNVKKSNWLIGENVMKGNYALRSMKSPGTAYKNHPLMGSDPQPAHIVGYVRTSQDDGGVHINSGIPNHAFYVTARNIGGKAWETAGRIWYLAMIHPALLKTKPNATFTEAKEALVEAAKIIYGKGSLEQKAVIEGWKEVGVE